MALTYHMVDQRSRICIASGISLSAIRPRSRPLTLLDDYLARTPRSRALFERATGSLPGRLDPDDRLHRAVPALRRGRRSGCGSRDVDGNVYRDFLGNYTSLILGHAHPAVVAAVEAQVRRGSAFAAPTETEVELAEEIRRRVPSIEQLRFTELRHRGDDVRHPRRAGVHRPAARSRSSSARTTAPTTWSWPGRAGVPARSAPRRRAAVGRSGRRSRPRSRGREGDLAAIIIEPVQGAGGVRAPDPAFLRFLRELTDAHRRAADLRRDHLVPGRARRRAGRFGVRPDLTTLGKIIGGGYPLAAFGGRADVMAVFDARRPGAVSHGGTFNGNPVAAAAGLATLRELTPDAYAGSTMLGERLRARRRRAIERDGHRRPGRRRRLALPGLRGRRR